MAVLSPYGCDWICVSCGISKDDRQAVYDSNPKPPHGLKNSLSTRVAEPYGQPAKHDHINNG